MNYGIILFFICACIFYLITKYYLALKDKKSDDIESFINESNKTNIEKLQDTYNITISYLNPNDSKLLVEKATEYYSFMNQPNINSRHCETIEELMQKYSSSLQTVTPSEKELIAKSMLQLLKNLKHYSPGLFKYSLYWLKNIRLAKAHAWLEAGMPHTIDNIIVMDENWFSSPRILTFFHELMHIHQRLRFYDYEDLYAKWGYYYYPKHIKGMETFYMLNRNNPDGTSPFWLWAYPQNEYNYQEEKTRIPEDDDNYTDYWWIGAVFKTSTPHNLTDVDHIAVKLTRSADGEFYALKGDKVNLKRLKPFNKYFGVDNNNYHPNEMSAKMMEMYYLFKIRDPSSKDFILKPGFKEFKNHMDNLIDNYYNYN